MLALLPQKFVNYKLVIYSGLKALEGYSQMISNRTKTLLIATAAVAVAGFFWVDHEGLVVSQKSLEASQPVNTTAPPVAVSVNGSKLDPEKPIKGAVGQPEVLSLTSDATSQVTVNVPGLHDDMVTVDPGQTVNLNVDSNAAGIYPIMEHGTMPNTRSVEGGTSGYDMEVGSIQLVN